MLIPALLVIICALLGGLAYFAWRAANLHAQVDELESLAPRAREVISVDKKLAAVNREYEALLAYCGGGVLLVGANNVIERANLTARYLLGVPTLNMIG